MEERKAWTKNDLCNGITVFQGIQTEFGKLSAVYLGPGGAFVWTECFEDPDTTCVLLKDLLHTTRLMLYSEDQGLYNPAFRSFSDPLPSEEVDAIAQSFVSGYETPFTCTEGELHAMRERLIRADAFSRGWYRDGEGRVYLRHGTVFREASPLDPDGQYYLALFGGVLGLHRFSLGKFFSGLLYLFTGGLLLCGWAIDLVFLLLGYQRDTQKRVLYRPENRLVKILCIPLGFLSSCLILFVIRSILLAVSLG